MRWMLFSSHLGGYLLDQKTGGEKGKGSIRHKISTRYLFKDDKRLSKYALDTWVKDLKMFIKT
jgi:hypothetical protein